MTQRKSMIFPLLILCLSGWILAGTTDDPDVGKVMKKIDELYRSSSSEGTIEMEITTPHWSRTLKCRMWSTGMEKTFIRILEPKKERGVSTLRIDNEMWNYLPKTDKVIKIPPSMMMGSWMGSDFTNDDLVKEITFVDDYQFGFTEWDTPEEGIIYLKCVPKPDVPVVWGHIIMAVRRKDHLPVWQKYYDEKGKLIREMVYREIKRFGNREIPSVMELSPKHKEGYKTTIRYLDIRFDIKVDSSKFSLRNLRTRI